ncbi:MAG: Oligopeptide-binding protein AppA [Paracidovorax wautersii]|uniref:Oligopeptide-binding protein AppA n=1 Tax=Paracidovorax wautersii TaxID=1177982 RepID=A0A7V8FPD2_9BURK|nr:MAG: Oligopeptide-binding protein AppA [Paracidovorax wautersii]
MEPNSIRRALLLSAALGGWSIGPAAAQAQSPSQKSTVPVRGGTLYAIVQPEPTVLTSTTNNNYPNGVVSANIYDGLLTYDESLNPQPGLATKWAVSADGKTITFHLRPGVKWHDGQPFTSADVKFSALEVWKKIHSRGRITFAPLDDVLTPDAHTAVFKLKSPSLVIFSALNAVESQILPRHLYEGTDIYANPHNLRPVGTGPFRFKEWRKGQYIELERNPDYWDAGKPYLDRLIFRVIPDAASRAAALETGDAWYAPFDAVPQADVQRLRGHPELEVTTRGYDWQSQYVFLEFNLRHPALAKTEVRQAFAHAIDKQALVDTVWYGLGKPATGPVPSTLRKFYTTQDVPQYAFDPAQAERLLDQAGYPRGEGGVRLTLWQDYQPFNETFKNNAEFIRQNLKRVGVDIKVRSQDLASFVKRVYTDYDFDIETGQWSPYLDPQIGVIRQYWSQSIAKGVPWTNASGYANPELDRLIEAVQVQADPARRVALFQQFQRIVQTDLPVLPLFEIHHFTVHNKRLHGLSRAPDGAFSSLKNAWIQT